ATPPRSDKSWNKFRRSRNALCSLKRRFRSALTQRITTRTSRAQSANSRRRNVGGSKNCTPKKADWTKSFATSHCRTQNGRRTDERSRPRTTGRRRNDDRRTCEILRIGCAPPYFHDREARDLRLLRFA